MGRRRKNAVYGYFSYDKTTNASICLVTGCGAIIKGQHGTNLLYHLSAKHEEEHNVVIRRNRLSDQTDEETENDRNIVNTSTGDFTSERKVLNLKKECVDLVTIHGRPFAMMDDQAFRNILNMISMHPRHLQSINSHSIRGLVMARANQTRQAIANDLKGKIISIKVDSATCRDRSFLGVNVQYINGSKVVLRSLGVMELHARSTAEFLKEKVFYVLRKYSITVSQIYTVTTDNGSNMLKMTRLINNDISEEEEDIASDDDDEIESEERDSPVFTLEERYNTEVYSVSSIRCAAHTLQLAVEDALRQDEAHFVIEEGRGIVRRLKTPTMSTILRAGRKKKPILDCATRWHSKLDMLERLLHLRDCCSTTPEDFLYVSNTTWTAIEDIIKSLMPSRILTKSLESEQLTLGDFYYYWTKCLLGTEKILTPLAHFICTFMKIRQAQLMENHTFLGALYLDPRFHVVLSPGEMEMAIQHLKTLWTQIIKLEKKSTHEEFTESEDLGKSDDSDDMEMLLAETEREKRRLVQYSLGCVNVGSLLEQFSRHPRLKPKENVLEFWEKKKLSNPQLHLIATTVLATPATQVSVERLFSSLKYILSALRYNLRDEIVEDILVLRNNREVSAVLYYGQRE